MSVAFLMGVDLGTQGIKAALFSSDGDCIAQAFVASRPHRPKPGHVEEDPEQQFDSVCLSISRCMKEAGVDRSEVGGLAVAGQMAGVLGVDRSGQHMTPYDSWLDTRCADQLDRIESAAGDEVIQKTGCAPSFNHGPKMLWWQKHRKADYRRIHAFVQPAAYATMRLCGLPGTDAFIDTTYLHFSGFSDNRQKQWDEGLCKTLDLDAGKLPRIVEPDSVVGSLTREAARRCGLAVDTPVAAGCGDTAASFLACGATRAGIAVDVSGTASVFTLTTDRFFVDSTSRTLGCGRSVIPDLWHPYAYINGGGLNIEWFREMLLSNTEDDKAKAGYEALESMVQHVVPNPDLPYFIPHFGGRVSPSQPDLRGAWANLSWEHGRSEMYYAILESVALEYALYLRQARQIKPMLKLDEVRVTGGGQESGYWNHLKCDALGVKLRTITRPYGAPMGAALLAGHAVGAIPDLAKTAERWAKPGRAVQPRQARHKTLQSRLARYQTLLKKLDPR